MLKLIKIFLLLILLFFSSNIILANENQEKIVIYFFTDPLCGDCKNAENFIKEKQADYPAIELNIYSISDTKKLAEIAKENQKEDYKIMAPTIFINDELLQFGKFTSKSEKMIIDAIEGREIETNCCIQKIPFTNIEIDISNWSLPFIAFALGSIDGFNVCSIGALILVLSIVFILKSRKKIFFCGGLFILTSVIIYGTLVFIWGKLFELLVGQLAILRVIVGFAALGGGIYFLKTFWRFFKFGPTCEISNSLLVKKATNKLKQAFDQPSKKIYLLAGSIIFFATVITIVELPCSIGVPLAFAGILTEAGVSLASYVLYILFYLFFYMLIELIVFVGAIFTKEIWFANSKAITWITLIGALVLFYLAFHYLF